ncbi:MAG: hypothetical protein KKE35_03825 [Actinobacteria bacterium]|nr:hypothetical protein [Actinomycetota bacterium]
MGIKIEKITVKNLGPIDSFSKDFGLFNLIYSRNECGKTFLTEFIIRSLFKDTKRWQFRENGSGKVTISGLDNVSLVEFSPGSGKKLEDYWENDETGLPLSMVKLLVSKGGESSIENSEEGIGKSLIKEIFSGISLLDKIDRDGNISRTVKGAQLEDGNINIGNAGEGKAYRQLQGEISRIDRLFSEIESKYTKGVLESYKTEEKLLKDHQAKLHKAKCYEAYLISENIKDLNKKLQENDEDELNELVKDISLYEIKKNEYNSKVSQLGQLHEKCRHYEWLLKVLAVYEKFSSISAKRPKTILAVLSGALIVATVLFSIFNISAGAIISVLAAVGLIAFYIIKLLSSSKNAGQNDELDKIKKEFKSKTGNELSDMVALNLELDRQKESYDMVKLLTKQVEELKIANEALCFSIMQKFLSFMGKQIPEPQWHTALNDKKMENRDLRADIESMREKMNDLAVREVEYLSEDPQVKFSYDEFEKARTALEDIQIRITEKEREIESLKYSICTETDDDSSIEWDRLLENLREKRFEKQNDLNISEAQIVAGILVHAEIDKLREEEDNKITQGLQSEIVLKPLMEVTKNYKKLFLDGDSLMVSDEYRDFCIKDLSTGAREQIMLALRIGFSSKILKQDTLFLILDDAFQHSDWKRRKILIDKLADIAKTGWQIIYLTMDDHIKELFDEAGKEFKSGQYKCFDLALGN